MAKKASTINIEERIWDEIEKYMKKYDINRNKAIEWIVLEHKSMLENGITIEQPTLETSFKQNYQQGEDSISTDDVVSVFETMPD